MSSHHTMQLFLTIMHYIVDFNNKSQHSLSRNDVSDDAVNFASRNQHQFSIIFLEAH